MGTDYRIMCKECNAMSESSIGSSYRLYSDTHDMVSFIKKHWNCEKEGIKISETYGFFDCRLDDCKPNTIPKWDKCIKLAGEALEAEKIYAREFMQRNSGKDEE